jgi:hypothetical protein
MHETSSDRRRRAGEFEQAFSHVFVYAGGRLQIRLETNRVKGRIRLKSRRDHRVTSGCGVDGSERLTGFPGKHRIGLSIAQLGFPKREFVRRQIGQRQQVVPGVLGNQPGHVGGADRAGNPHPFRLEMVSFDRGFPDGGNAQARQGTLDAVVTASRGNLPDFRRNPAAQWGEFRLFVFGDKPEFAQRRHDIVRRRLLRHGHDGHRLPCDAHSRRHSFVKSTPVDFLPRRKRLMRGNGCASQAT